MRGKKWGFVSQIVIVYNDLKYIARYTCYFYYYVVESEQCKCEQANYEYNEVYRIWELVYSLLAWERNWYVVVECIVSLCVSDDL